MPGDDVWSVVKKQDRATLSKVPSKAAMCAGHLNANKQQCSL